MECTAVGRGAVGWTQWSVLCVVGGGLCLCLIVCLCLPATDVMDESLLRLVGEPSVQCWSAAVVCD